MVSEKKILNKEQLKAIEYGKGPLLIIAGAGTGKTTVITERIKYLISGKLAKPQEILALTFTEKAALEMEERTDQILPYGYSQMWISTFHSFCDHILRDEALHIGLNSRYVLMTEAETIIFLRQHLFEFSLDYFRPAGNPNKFLNGLIQHFSRLKDEDVSPKEYFRWAQDLRSKIKDQKDEEIKKNLELAKAYQKYEALKINKGVMDFADLVSQTLVLFRQRKNILQKYQQKFKYILVDEFQDTNISQNELIKLLAGKKADLTVVADDDQSIYRFRGSSVSNVIQFRKNYPQVKIITLTKNYRSTQEILNRSYDLIQHNNPDRLEIKEKINKKLVSTRQFTGEKIELLIAERVEHEADLVSEEIKKLIKWKRPGLNKRPGLYEHKDIAVLVRANNHADPFVRAFLRKGIPFQFLGPSRLFRQEEVKDLISYLKVLYNFEDNVAFFRVLSLVIFNLSARDIAAIRNYAKKFNFSLFEAAEQAEKILISSKSKEQIAKIVAMIHRHLKLIPKETAGQILYYFLEDSGILVQLTQFKTAKDEQKALNIAKFFDKLKTYESEHEDSSIEVVVDWINLKLEMGESPLATDTDWNQENKVNILTLHSAKGLEFPIVFLVNLVNDRFPTRERKEQIPIPDELIKESLPEGDYHEQEERRLFYVGMTRAKDRLYFTSAKFYGEGKRIKKISPFVFEALGNKLVTNNLQPVTNNQLSILDFKPVSESLSIIPVLPCLAGRQAAGRHYPLPIKVTYLSYSQLETFKRCPLQYKYKYILKIPVRPSAPASFGTSLHQSLKDFYKAHLEAKKPSKADLLSFLTLNWQKEGYTSKAHEQKMYQRAQKMLEEFFKQGYQKLANPVVLEQTFVIKIASDLKIGGRLDRVDKLKDGSIEIIDYKTGKVPSQKAIDKNLQMTVYCMAASNPAIYKKEPEEVILSFYFLETQEKISTKRTIEDLDKAKKEIINLKQEITQSDFLPKPGPLCDFCDFKLLCPAWH